MKSLKRKSRFRSPYNLRSTRQRVMSDIGAKQIDSLSYHSNSQPMCSIDEQISYLKRLPLDKKYIDMMMMELKKKYDV